MRFLGGSLLIASPYLADRNFFRSVVLIVSHDEDHAFGLLLNRPGYETLGEVWAELSGCEQNREERIRTGGPLEGPLMVIHQTPACSDTEIVSDVHLATTQESVGRLVSGAVDPLIPLVGYSGWGPGQLEVELEVGGWMTVPATSDNIFADPVEHWEIVARQVSNTILAGVDLRHAPQDPRWN